ncbi:MAG: isopentenyl-diphosphate Delta-isomerase [Pseudomonadota bacterium]
MPSINPQVILVDQDDNPIGTMEKYQAHREGQLHRAFSVFLINRQQQILLQQRSPKKYHSPLLWSNTCCSHPLPEEDIITAAKRRLFEELGIEVTQLEIIDRFHYKKSFDNGMTENEMDYVVVGTIADAQFNLNPDEVAALRWLALDEIEVQLKQDVDNFTYWFPQALQILKSFLNPTVLK